MYSKHIIPIFVNNCKAWVLSCDAYYLKQKKQEKESLNLSCLLTVAWLGSCLVLFCKSSTCDQ